MGQSLASLLDKAWQCLAFGSTVVDDAIEVVCITRGIDRETLVREPSLMTIVNSNSPLRLDGPMSDGLIEMATWGQPVVATPFTLAGAMTPATLAGALAQQNAEALFMMALTQIVRPGAPMVYGGFTSNVDMRTGSPAFGTPEYVKAALATGQLARRYGLPHRSSNVTGSAVVDAQAAYESQMSIWGSVMPRRRCGRKGLCCAPARARRISVPRSTNSSTSSSGRPRVTARREAGAAAPAGRHPTKESQCPKNHRSSERSSSQSSR